MPASKAQQKDCKKSCAELTIRIYNALSKIVIYYKYYFFIEF